jgi:hypothetical protein
MKAKVTFHKLIQEKQDGVPSELNQNQMISRAYFILEVGGKQYGDMSVILRQPFGTEYAKEPIEAEKPSGSYTGNWNHNEFRDAAEDYYRRCMGGAISFGPDISVSMDDNIMEFSKSYEIDIPE